MNREILFRGKRIDNGEWVYGYLRAFDDGSYHITTKVERNVARHIDEKPFYTLYGVEHEVDPKTVGQYTGLKDKNSKKIFEGDVLYDDYGEVYGIVVFDDGGFRISICNFLEDLFEFTDCPIVSNKWDNPELLKVLGGG